MRTLVLLSLALLLLAPQLARPTDVSGPVSGSWNPAGNPYDVIDRIWIESGQTLEIQPGVQVIFRGWYKFLIYGRLQAAGTEEDSITFTAADTTVGWHGLRFYDINTQPDSSRLVYCTISYGKSSSVNTAGDDKNGGAIFCSNSGKLRIEHCLIAHNQTGDMIGANGITGDPGTNGDSVATGHGGALYLTMNSSPVIAFNTISYNQTGNAHGGNGGNGIDVSGGGGYYVYGCSGGDGGNAETGSGGAIYCSNSSAEISFNIFQNNHAGDATAGHGGYGGDGTAEYGNGGGVGGWGGYGGTATSGNGGAISLEISNGSLIMAQQNIFISNFTGSADGGAGGSGGGGYNGYEGGGLAGWGRWGRSGVGGAIHLNGPLVAFSQNLFYDFNHTGYATGGDGGDAGYGPNEPANGGWGGDGFGGDGACFYADNVSATLQNLTVAFSICGSGYGGAGGMGANNGQPGISVSGSGAIIFNSGNLQISNSILWDNVEPSIDGSPLVAYSCIQDGFPGIGNITANPMFVNPDSGDFHLQSLTGSYHNGQWLPDPYHSPCIDAGDPASGFVNEPAPNGARINMGFEGNTLEASKSATFNAFSGPVSGVWIQAASPYYIWGDVWVPPDSALTIQPGVQVIFYWRYKFSVMANALFQALGTRQDSIIFTPALPDEHWRGLRFLSASDSSRLQFCQIRHGSADGLGDESRGGGVFAANCDLTIVNCSFENCAAAQTGGGIHGSQSSLHIQNNLLRNCEANYGGGISLLNSMAEILNNTLVDNSASMGAGIRCYNSSPTISNCILWDNAADQIYLAGSSNPVVSYSDIQGGWAGIGNLDIDPLFADIANGDYHLQSTEGSYHNGAWLADPNYSPCIDAGDPESAYQIEPMPNGGRINLGFEGGCEDASLSSNLGANSQNASLPLSFALDQNYPNPFNAATTITFGLPAASWVKVEVFDISGRLVSPSGSGTTPTTGFYTAGVHEVTFDGSDLASGIYLVRFRAKPSLAGQAGNYHAVKKMILLK